MAAFLKNMCDSMFCHVKAMPKGVCDLLAGLVITLSESNHGSRIFETTTHLLEVFDNFLRVRSDLILQECNNFITNNVLEKFGYVFEVFYRDIDFQMWKIYVQTEDFDLKLERLSLYAAQLHRDHYLLLPRTQAHRSAIRLDCT